MTHALTITKEAEELLDEIQQDIWRVFDVWDGFRYLFAGEKFHVEVLNASAPEFFGMTQRLMFDHVILGICRMTDPASNRSQENVTLRRLLQATDWETTDPQTFERMKKKLDQVDRICKPCRAHRNKRISHKDLAAFRKMFNLPVATLKMIDDAINAVHGVINDFRKTMDHGEIMLDAINADRDVKTLIRTLTNRASQKRNETSIILYTAGQRLAELHCGYCGEKQQIPFYPNGEPSPQKMSRWHFSKCHGVIGCEEIAVETVERDGNEAPRRFLIDLKQSLDSC